MKSPIIIVRIILFVSCLTSFYDSCAQFSVEKSIQLLLYGYGKEPGIVSLGEQGAIIYSEAVNNATGSNRKWEVICLDADFGLDWKTSFESEPQFGLKQVRYFDGDIYLMFEDANIPNKSVLFVRADIDAHNFEYFKIDEFLPREIADFEILGNSLFLIGTVKKNPEILKFRFGDIRPEVLKGLYSENNEILDIDVLSNAGVIQIISRIKKNKTGNSLLVVKQFDEGGKIAKDIKIESSKGHNLLDARANTDAKGNICIVGTFASGSSKQSTGMFSLVHQEDQLQQVYYYDYTNLHHFFDYMSLEDREKTSKKYQKSGNSTGMHNAIHQPGSLKRVDNQWIYTGEIIRSGNKYYSFKSSTAIEYNELSHAVVLGVANSGKLIWDDVVALNDLLTRGSYQQVFVDQLEGDLITYHLNGFNLNYQFVGDATAEPRNGELLIEVENMDQFNPEGNLNAAILPWYENKFMTYGSFSAVNRSGQYKNIFYINKVSIAPSNAMNK